MPRVFSVQTRASGLEIRWKTWTMPSAWMRYSAQPPGKSYTELTSTQGTAPVAAKRRTRFRWVCPAV